jgi:hypothetical protein
LQQNGLVVFARSRHLFVVDLGAKWRSRTNVDEEGLATSSLYEGGSLFAQQERLAERSIPAVTAHRSCVAASTLSLVALRAPHLPEFSLPLAAQSTAIVVTRRHRDRTGGDGPRCRCSHLGWPHYWKSRLACRAPARKEIDARTRWRVAQGFIDIPFTCEGGFAGADPRRGISDSARRDNDRVRRRR